MGALKLKLIGEFESERPLIRDLIVEGLSLARTQKEVASILSSIIIT